MDKNKLVLIGSGIAILLAILFAVVFLSKKDVVVDSQVEKKNAQIIKNITAKIDLMDSNSIGITTSDGKKLTLSVLLESASFIEQTIKGDGIFSEKIIKLTDVPKNKMIDIQYNSETNEVMLITVR